MNRSNLMQGVAIAALLAASAAAQIVKTGDITVSETWTSNNVYELQGQCWVLGGATLTIQPGTVIRSQPGSVLVITRGCQINAAGTRDLPITWTSTADNGTYRHANNEWGNLTICGAAYVSSTTIGNTSTPSSSNVATMEGLIIPPGTTTFLNRMEYGGGNDNDNSGTLTYCSFRYGGLATQPNKELNGLSMGGIGRGTDVHHIEILGNKDDGLETWGGTVNYKYVAIADVGDDSMDIDQGWRGKAQFGLIIQGYSSAVQGSGFSDNAFEMDGAERCDWQPVTTCAIHNFTVVGGGYPGDSSGTDSLVEFRDNVRVQFQNCLFLDGGDAAIKDVGTDAEGSNTTALCGDGISTGSANIPTAFSRMQIAANTYWGINGFPGAPELTNAQAYTAQNPAGNLIQFRGCKWHNNLASNAYTAAISTLVFTGGGGTNHANNSIELSLPITSLVRDPVTTVGTNKLLPFSFIDPTPVGASLTAAELPPADGFYTAARWTGGFAQGNNWLIGWTALSQFGKTTSSQANNPITGVERAGINGVPVHYTTGTWAPSTTVTLQCANVGDLGGFSAGAAVLSPAPLFLPIFGGTLVPNFAVGAIAVATGPSGSLSVGPIGIPPGLSGFTYYTQFATFDAGVPAGEFAFSNAQSHLLP